MALDWGLKKGDFMKRIFEVKKIVEAQTKLAGGLFLDLLLEGVKAGDKVNSAGVVINLAGMNSITAGLAEVREVLRAGDSLLLNSTTSGNTDFLDFPVGRVKEIFFTLSGAKEKITFSFGNANVYIYGKFFEFSDLVKSLN